MEARAKTKAETGVEMEALTAASVALLTLYDMLKAVDKAMTIDGVRVLALSPGAVLEIGRLKIGKLSLVHA